MHFEPRVKKLRNGSRISDFGKTWTIPEIDPLQIAAFTWTIALLGHAAAARLREITDRNLALSPRAINWINRTKQKKRILARAL
jgi:hypothetical protein